MEGSVNIATLPILKTKQVVAGYILSRLAENNPEILRARTIFDYVGEKLGCGRREQIQTVIKRCELYILALKTLIKRHRLSKELGAADFSEWADEEALKFMKSHNTCRLSENYDRNITWRQVAAFLDSQTQLAAEYLRQGRLDKLSKPIHFCIRFLSFQKIVKTSEGWRDVLQVLRSLSGDIKYTYSVEVAGGEPAGQGLVKQREMTKNLSKKSLSDETKKESVVKQAISRRSRTPSPLRKFLKAEPDETGSTSAIYVGPKKKPLTASTPKKGEELTPETQVHLPERESPMPRRKSPSAERISRSPQRKSPGQKRKIPSPERNSPSQERRSPSSEKLDPLAKRKSPSPQTKSQSPEKKSPLPERKSPPPEKKSPSPERKSPPPEKKSPSLERSSPPPEKKSPLPERKSLPPEKNAPLPERKSPSPEGKLPTPERKSPSPERITQLPETRPPSPIRQIPVLERKTVPPVKIVPKVFTLMPYSAPPAAFNLLMCLCGTTASLKRMGPYTAQCMVRGENVCLICGRAFNPDFRIISAHIKHHKVTEKDPEVVKFNIDLNRRLSVNVCGRCKAVASVYVLDLSNHRIVSCKLCKWLSCLVPKCGVMFNPAIAQIEDVNQHYNSAHISTSKK